jgi:putative peptidoglycan lipid II flippase
MVPGMAEGHRRDPGAGPPTASRSLGGVIAGVAPATLAVQICAFGASTALAAVFGAVDSTDAYYIALTVPLFVYGVLLAALRLGGIPALTDIYVGERRRFDAASSELVWAAAVGATAVGLAATVLAYLAIPLVFEESEGTVALARTIVLELAPLATLAALTAALGAILAVIGRFTAPVAVLALDPLLRLLLIVSLGKSLGIHVVAVGNLAGSAMAVAVLWVLVRRQGVELRLPAPLRTPLVSRVLTFSLPLLIATSALMFNPVIDRVMAAPLGVGSVTELQLALQVFNVPATLLATSLIAPVLAVWEARYSTGGWEHLRASASNAILLAISALPPIVVLGAVLRQELTVAIFQGGAYSPEAVSHTADALGMFLLGVPAQVLTLVFATVFLVRQNPWVPMYIGFANVVLNAALNLALRGELGVSGIALSTTLTLTVLCATYALIARRRYGRLLTVSPRGALGSAAVSSALMAGSSLLIVSLLPPATGRLSALVVIAVCSAVGVSIHLAILVVRRDSLPTMMMSALQARLGRSERGPNGQSGL